MLDREGGFIRRSKSWAPVFVLVPTTILPAADMNRARVEIGWIAQVALGLGVFDATMIAMGGIIGSGIFIQLVSGCATPEATRPVTLSPRRQDRVWLCHLPAESRPEPLINVLLGGHMQFMRPRRPNFGDGIRSGHQVLWTWHRVSSSVQTRRQAQDRFLRLRRWGQVLYLGADCVFSEKHHMIQKNRQWYRKEEERA